MERKNPDDVIQQAQKSNEEIRATAIDTVELFIDEEGHMFPFTDAVSYAEKNGIDDSLSNNVISHLASDHVDPLIHVSTKDERFVGVKEFDEGDWWYAYRDYDDELGEAWRVVCMQCVKECHHTKDVGTVFEPHLDTDFDSFELLLDWFKEKHFENAHEIDAKDVERQIGASLATGTTIAGNTAWHDGNVSGGSNVSIGSTSVSLNQGSGSGLDADTVDGNEASALGDEWEFITEVVDSDSGTTFDETADLSGVTYDKYRIDINIVDQSGSNPNLLLRVNGVTSNYISYDVGATNTGTNSELILGGGAGTIGDEVAKTSDLIMYPARNGGSIMTFEGPVVSPNNLDQGLEAGAALDVSGDANNVRLFFTQQQQTGTVRFYGANL